MNWNEIPTLVGLALNLVALVAVAYQIYLNRRALDLARASIDLAKRSIDEQRRTLQMEMLPKAYWVFVVSGQLATWRSVIEMTVHDLQNSGNSGDTILIYCCHAEYPLLPSVYGSSRVHGG